jgi:flagella basal body P-ring formation protein FlgA
MLCLRHAVLASLLTAAPAFAAEPVAHLVPAVRVAGGTVSLGDVVRLSDGTAVAWAEQPLLSGLMHGETRRVERQQVEQALAALGVAVQWRGAETTTVQRRAPSVAQELIVARAQQALETALRARYQDVEVRPARQRLPAIEDGDLVVRLPTDTTARRRMMVFVDRRDGDRTAQSVPVWFEVEAYQDVLVAARSLPPRTLLGADALIRERRDVAASAVPWLAEEGVRYWTTTPVPAGAVLTVGNVAVAPPVRADEAVDVEVAVGAVRLHARGRALTNGFIGDEVRVLPLVGVADPFVARVVGDSKVLVR